MTGASTVNVEDLEAVAGMVDATRAAAERASELTLSIPNVVSACEDRIEQLVQQVRRRNDRAEAEVEDAQDALDLARRAGDDEDGYEPDTRDEEERMDEARRELRLAEQAVEVAEAEARQAHRALELFVARTPRLREMGDHLDAGQAVLRRGVKSLLDYLNARLRTASASSGGVTPAASSSARRIVQAIVRGMNGGAGSEHAKAGRQTNCVHCSLALAAYFRQGNWSVSLPAPPPIDAAGGYGWDQIEPRMASYGLRVAGRVSLNGWHPLTERLASLTPGSGALVVLEGKSGHMVNAENVGGEVLLLDGQTEQVFPASEAAQHYPGVASVEVVFLHA